MVLETEKPPIATDWRGTEIRIGSRIAWSSQGWGIGTVVKISRDCYGEILLGVLWEERSGWDKNKEGNTTNGVRGRNCVVWPELELDDEWGVELHFADSTYLVELRNETYARQYLTTLLAEKPQRAERIVLVRRVLPDGKWAEEK